MKHFYFSLLFFLLPAMTVAQERDYHPFIEEGKVCYVGWYPYGDFRMPPMDITTYRFEGDTIVAGHSCKRWMMGNQMLASVFEEDRRVYFIKPGDDTPKLLYDFSVSKGDQIEVSQFGNGKTVKCYIEDVRYDSDGVRHIFLYDDIGLAEMDEMKEAIEVTDDYSAEDRDRDLKAMYTYTWTEGYGTWDTPEINVGLGGDITGNYSVMIRVVIGDKIVYDIPDANWSLDAIGNVNLEEKGAKTDKTLYDLSGRRVTEPQKGIYIQNGRKRVK